MRRTIYMILLLFPLLVVEASDIKIENKHLRILPDRFIGDYKSVTKENYPNLQNELTFTISWKNSWNNKKNHDAAWVFVKLLPSSELGIPSERTEYVHARIVSATIVGQNGQSPEGIIVVSKDSLGFFIHPKNQYRGDVSWTVSLNILPSDLYRFGSPFAIKSEIGAIEMVHIPKSSYYLGATSEKYLGLGSFYKVGKNGVYKDAFHVTSEGPITVGRQEGNLWYNNFGGEISAGDNKGPIPAEYPKGYQAFYIMKYELSQGQYAKFLNTLTGVGTNERSIIGGRNYYQNRGSIQSINGVYVAGDPHRPANFLGWADIMAYLDWAALRPVTEMELEKAMRGPVYPKVDGAYAWGSRDHYQLQRGYRTDGSFVFFGNTNEKDLTHENLPKFGASYYWVMDLTGGLLEPVIPASTVSGRNFNGSHGDGVVTMTYAEQGNTDWPQIDRTRTGQIPEGGGFKGGGKILLNEMGNDSHPFEIVSSRYAVDRAVAVVFRNPGMGCRGARTVGIE